VDPDSDVANPTLAPSAGVNAGSATQGVAKSTVGERPRPSVELATCIDLLSCATGWPPSLHNHAMSLSGTSTAEIKAPLDEVWALVEDVESAPEWQGGLNALRAIDHDDQGRPVRCETETDAKIRSVKSVVHFTYDGPTRLTWTQEQGDLKSVQGSWELEDLGGESTRATYSIEVDLGRRLGMLVRGPIVDVLRYMLAGARAGELKKRIEGS